MQPSFRDCPPEAFVLKIKDFGHSDLFRISDFKLLDNSLPNMMIQSTTNNHLSIINNHLAMAVLYICRAISTFVERALQISFIMQNKANFRKSQMNVNKVLAKDYENIANWALGENKPNTKPNKANLLNAQMNVNKVLTKDYENIANWALGQNKPNTKPIQTQSNPMLTYTLYGSRRS